MSMSALNKRKREEPPGVSGADYGAETVTQVDAADAAQGPQQADPAAVYPAATDDQSLLIETSTHYKELVDLVKSLAPTIADGNEVLLLKNTLQPSRMFAPAQASINRFIDETSNTSFLLSPLANALVPALADLFSNMANEFVYTQRPKHLALLLLLVKELQQRAIQMGEAFNADMLIPSVTAMLVSDDVVPFMLTCKIICVLLPSCSIRQRIEICVNLFSSSASLPRRISWEQMQLLQGTTAILSELLDGDNPLLPCSYLLGQLESVEVCWALSPLKNAILARIHAVGSLVNVFALDLSCVYGLNAFSYSQDVFAFNSDVEETNKIKLSTIVQLILQNSSELVGKRMQLVILTDPLTGSKSQVQTFSIATRFLSLVCNETRDRFQQSVDRNQIHDPLLDIPLLVRWNQLAEMLLLGLQLGQSAGDLKTVASMLITFFQSATVEATKLVGQSSIKVMVIWLYLQLLEFIGRLQSPELLEQLVETGNTIIIEPQLANPREAPSNQTPKLSCLNCINAIFVDCLTPDLSKRVIGDKLLAIESHRGFERRAFELSRNFLQALKTNSPIDPAFDVARDPILPLSLFNRDLFNLVMHIIISGSGELQEFPNTKLTFRSMPPLSMHMYTAFNLTSRITLVTKLPEFMTKLPASSDQKPADIVSPAALDHFAAICNSLHMFFSAPLNKLATVRIPDWVKLALEGQVGERQLSLRSLQLSLEVFHYRLLPLINSQSFQLQTSILTIMLPQLLRVRKWQLFLSTELFAVTTLQLPLEVTVLVKSFMQKVALTKDLSVDDLVQMFSPLVGPSPWIRQTYVLMLAKCIRLRPGVELTESRFVRVAEAIVKIDNLSSYPVLSFDERTSAHFPQSLQSYLLSLQQEAGVRRLDYANVDQLIGSFNTTDLHNALLTTTGQSESLAKLVTHYSEPQNQKMFLCVIWSFMTFPGGKITVHFRTVAKVMQSITPDVRVECTWYFLDYLVKKAEAEGIESFRFDVLDDLIWTHRVISFEHVLAGLSRGSVQDCAATFRILHYLLLESPEWTQRQSFFLSLGFETNFVNSQNYMDKLNNYFASYPEGFDPEQIGIPLTPNNAETASVFQSNLPIFFGLQPLRILPVLDGIISRHIEHGNYDYLKALLERVRPLYAYHQSPALFVHDILTYYAGAPLLREPEIKRLLVGLVDKYADALSPPARSVFGLDNDSAAETMTGALFGSQEHLSILVDRIVQKSKFVSPGRLNDASAYENLFSDNRNPMLKTVRFASIEVLLCDNFTPDKFGSVVLSYLKSSKTITLMHISALSQLMLMLPPSSYQEVLQVVGILLRSFDPTVTATVQHLYPTSTGVLFQSVQWHSMFEDIHQVDLPSISSVYPMSQLADRPDVNFPLKTDTSRLLVLVQSLLRFDMYDITKLVLALLQQMNDASLSAATPEQTEARFLFTLRMVAPTLFRLAESKVQPLETWFIPILLELFKLFSTVEHSKVGANGLCPFTQLTFDFLDAIRRPLNVLSNEFVDQVQSIFLSSDDRIQARVSRWLAGPS